MKAGHTYTGIVMDYCHVVLMGGDSPHVRFDMCGPEDIKFWEEIGERYWIYHVYDARVLVVEDRLSNEQKFFYLPPRAYIVMDHIDHSFTVIDKLDGFEDNPHSASPHCSPTGRVSFYPPGGLAPLVRKKGHLGDIADGMLADLFPTPQRPNEDHIPSDPEELEVEPDEQPKSLRLADVCRDLPNCFPSAGVEVTCFSQITYATFPEDINNLLMETHPFRLELDRRQAIRWEMVEPVVIAFQRELFKLIHGFRADPLRLFDQLVELNVSPLEGAPTMEKHVPIFPDGVFDSERMRLVNKHREGICSIIKKYESGQAGPL